MDNNIQKLRREYAENPSEITLKKIQNLNKRSGLSANDAEYLNKYLSLCDETTQKLKDALTSDIDSDEAFILDKASAELETLNEEFKLKIVPSSIRNTLMICDAYTIAKDRLNNYNFWYGSQNC